MPTFLEMPPEIMQEIVDFVGFPGIFTLRDVCHDLQSFVDNMKLHLKLDALFITISRETMRIYCKKSCKSYKIKYGKSDEKQFYKMLETILMFQKSTLTIFSIVDKSPMPGFYEKIKGTLESRPSLLKVDALLMKCKNQYEIQSVLSFLEPGILETINFEGCRRFETLELNGIVGLEQWKQAKTLFINHFIVSTPLTDFGHFWTVHAHFGSIDWEELDSLRMIFLASPNTKRGFHIYRRTLNGAEQWRESLGPATDEFNWKWQFRYANSHVYLVVAELLDRIVFESCPIDFL